MKQRIKHAYPQVLLSSHSTWIGQLGLLQKELYLSLLCRYQSDHPSYQLGDKYYVVPRIDGGLGELPAPGVLEPAARVVRI